MPSNDDFSFKVLVGGVALPEYEKDNMSYVECCLFTPYSYNQRTEDRVSDELECQSWPVTPYSICTTAQPTCDHCYYRIFVDGQHVKSKSLTPGQQRIIRGFRDGNCEREFLFSLPRFPKDQDDQTASVHLSRVGLIEVECYNAVLKTSKHTFRSRNLHYHQANKKESQAVTSGNYMMVTTKAGRKLSIRQNWKKTDCWVVNSLRSRLSVKYLMNHTLQDMGITVQPIPFSTNLSQNSVNGVGPPVNAPLKFSESLPSSSGSSHCSPSVSFLENSDWRCRQVKKEENTSSKDFVPEIIVID